MARKQNREPNTAQQLAHAVKAHRKTERTRNEAIYRAHLAGNSLRAIAMETDLSHESVRSIVVRMKAYVEREANILANEPYALSLSTKLRAEANHTKRRTKLNNLTTVKPTDS